MEEHEEEEVYCAWCGSETDVSPCESCLACGLGQGVW